MLLEGTWSLDKPSASVVVRSSESSGKTNGLTLTLTAVNICLVMGWEDLGEIATWTHPPDFILDLSTDVELALSRSKVGTEWMPVSLRRTRRGEPSAKRPATPAFKGPPTSAANRPRSLHSLTNCHPDICMRAARARTPCLCSRLSERNFK